MTNLLSCYNYGCGQKFDPNKSESEDCTYHPGVPFFHDAYKGWTCCNKKSTDFTEFLNIKGCTKGSHSNTKPIEASKPEDILKEDAEVPIKENKPVVKLVRSDFHSTVTCLTPKIASNLKKQIDEFKPILKKPEANNNKEIVVGTVCKNRGCDCGYDTSAAEGDCVYHPGVPIFHEGLKFWSCCTKRTTDFTAFMNQPGCETGKHKWIQDDDEKRINCRYEWHQTAREVVVTVYAKMYHYAKSYVKVNPVRLNIKLVFPEQNDAEYNVDLELRGIINVEKSNVNMLPTKVEINLCKAEPGTWAELNFIRAVEEIQPQSTDDVQNQADEDSDSDIDLDDVGPLRAPGHCTITELE